MRIPIHPNGISDHGALLGLSDDDHPQYLTVARGDALYSPLGHTHPYLAIANDLSDLHDAATARTNLGLVSGGAGDIWTHRAGDTMTGTLEIDVPTATTRGLILKSADDNAASHLYEARKADGTVIISHRTAIAGTSTADDSFLNITANLPSTFTTTVTGVDFQLTGVGSQASNFTYSALRISLNAGYTGTAITRGVTVNNNSASTRVTLFTSGNVGLAATTSGVVAGYNIGVSATASNSSLLNLGFVATSLTDTAGANVGFASRVSNTTGVQIGAAFLLTTAANPTWESAALLADNGSTTSPIFLARDNGTRVLEILDGGLVNIKNGALSGSSTTEGFLTVTGTLPSNPSTFITAVQFVITGAGSSSNGPTGMQVILSAGYTGAGGSNAFTAANASAGTSAAINGGNISALIQTSGATAGYNAGARILASGSSTLNVGAFIHAFSATAGSNIGIFGRALNATTSNIAGLFALSAGTTVPTLESAALIADNIATTSPIFLARDNGTHVFEVLDGGLVNIKNGVIDGTNANSNLLNITGTFPSSTSANMTALNIVMTGAGSGADAEFVIQSTLNAGYTGSNTTSAGTFINNSAGTNTQAGTGNNGVRGLALGTGSGNNYGVVGNATGSTALNIGLNGQALGSNAGSNVAVSGRALNSSSGSNIGGLFILAAAFPTLESAALIADNSSTSSPIFLARDNGTKVWSILDGGHTLWGDAVNMQFGTTTGTKIGTSASQLIGLWNATPIAQPTTGIAGATFVANAGTAVNDASTFDGYTIGQVVKALRNMGALA